MSNNIVYAADYGVTPSNSDNLSALNDALDALDALGGGVLILPAGNLVISDTWTIGDGSNSAQSSKHHRVRIVGAGSGSSPSVTNIEIPAPTTLTYNGSTSSSVAAMEIAGPLHNINLEHFSIDAASKAGVGLRIIHLTDFSFRHIVVSNFTANSYVFTTRTGFPSGVSYGCANGSIYDCFAYDPASHNANGVVLDSGVSTSNSLVGNPDSANLDFYGGVYFYGGSTGTSGLYLRVADNNTFCGMQLIPYGGFTGQGSSIYFAPWPGFNYFPMENNFSNMGLIQPIGGTSGTGGNRVDPLASSDGASFPSMANLHGSDYAGKVYVNGTRTFRHLSLAQTNVSSPQNTISTSFVDVSGLSTTVDCPQDSKVVVSFAGNAAKWITGDGSFVINVNGTDYNDTHVNVCATGYSASVSGRIVVDFSSAGTNVPVKVRFKSGDGNRVDINNGTLIAEVLY